MKLSSLINSLEKILPIYNGPDKLDNKYLLNVGSTNFLPFVNITAALITTPILIRSLGKSDYGVWALLQSFILWLSLAQLGFNTTLTRELAAIRTRHDRHGRARTMVSSIFWASIGIALILFIISLFIIPILDRILNIDSKRVLDTIPAFYLIFMVFVCSHLTACLNSLFYAYDKFYLRNLITAGGNALSALLIISLFLSYKAGIIHLAGITLFSALLQLLTTAIITYQTWNIIPAPKYFESETIRTMVQPSIGYLILSLTDLIIFKSDNLIIGAFLSLESLAVYSIAFNMTDYVMRFIWNFSDMLSPTISSLYYAGDKYQLRKLIIKMLCVTVGVTSIASTSLYYFGPGILKIWAGEDNVVPRPILNVFITTISVYSISHACGVFINAIGKHKPVAYASVIEALLNIIISLSLLPAYGSLGVALGTLLAHLLTTAWFLPYLTYKHFPPGNQVS